MAIDERTINEFEQILNQVAVVGGQKEQTRISTGLEVINASPAGLSDYIIIKDDRGEGTYITALKSPGVLYSNGDLVSVIFIEGSESVAFQQSTDSGGSPVAVSKLVSPDLSIDPVFSAGNDSNVTAVGDIILSGGADGLPKIHSISGFRADLGTTTASERWGSIYMGANEEIDINGAFTIDAGGAMTIDVTGGLTVDYTSTAVFNEAGNSVDLRIEGNTVANLFYIDASADRIGIGGATPANKVGFHDGATGHGIAFGREAFNFTTIWSGYSGAALTFGAGVMGDTVSTNIKSSYGSSMGRAMIEINGFTGTGGNIRWYTNSDATIARGSNVTMNERMYLGDTGDFGIAGGGGAFVPSHTLELNDDDGAKTTTTTWTTTSDKKTKRNIKPYNNGLDFVLSLPNPVLFEYNGYKGTAKGVQGVGFLAQDLQKLQTRMTKVTSRGPKKGLLNFNPHELFFAFVNAIKEIDARLNTLEAV